MLLNAATKRMYANLKGVIRRMRRLYMSGVTKSHLIKLYGFGVHGSLSLGLLIIVSDAKSKVV